MMNRKKSLLWEAIVSVEVDGTIEVDGYKKDETNKKSSK